uniref:Uncharacterized protein n=1 Tax=Plectus sambesii TaxID=2011161 RepID=A0A914VPK3_9BILA
METVGQTRSKRANQRTRVDQEVSHPNRPLKMDTFRGFPPSEPRARRLFVGLHKGKARQSRLEDEIGESIFINGGALTGSRWIRLGWSSSSSQRASDAKAGTPNRRTHTRATRRRCYRTDRRTERARASTAAVGDASDRLPPLERELLSENIHWVAGEKTILSPRNQRRRHCRLSNLQARVVFDRPYAVDDDDDAKQYPGRTEAPRREVDVDELKRGGGAVGCGTNCGRGR